MCELMTMLTIGSTILGGAGAIQTANAQSAAAKASASVNDMNARIADRAAKDALERGKKDEQQHRAKTAALIGQQRASMAANGVDLTFGSPLDLLVDTAVLGEMDALTIRSNAYKEERDIRQQANNFRTQAGVDRASASSIKTGGYLNAAGTLLGGGAKAYSVYKTGKL